MKNTVLYLVVPCYNEEEVLKTSAARLKDKMQRLMQAEKISKESRVMFVNDGSRDRTWKLIYDLTQQDELFAGLSFSRNFGHQSAILAGMLASRERADAVVTIDADLQQDIEALDKFIECYDNGCDIVYGIRNDRDTDGFFKKTTAGIFYKLMHLLGCRTITNHADYRLLSKKALDALAQFKEVNLFLRGLIPTMGFPSDVVYFDVKEREAGQSKYTLRKMVALAVDGITSMSTRPLQIITGVGFLTFFISLGIFISSVVDWARGRVVAGWTTIVALICLIGGMMMISQGIIGAYLGKMYLETKGRPRYIVDAMILHGAARTDGTKRPEEAAGTGESQTGRENSDGQG